MSDIKYPAGVKIPAGKTRKSPTKGKKFQLKVAPGNRGIAFESQINDTNLYYQEKGLCLVTKRPTPINVVKVDYTHGAIITQAYFEAQSTTDYNGVYKGRYLDFEAKSVRSKTSFPLSNIPPQQISHLKEVLAHGGIAFFLIRFELLKKTFLMEARYIIEFYEKRERASIPISAFDEHGVYIPETYRPVYDYLPVVERLFF